MWKKLSLTGNHYVKEKVQCNEKAEWIRIEERGKVRM
jgi:hypothetical protein